MAPPCACTIVMQTERPMPMLRLPSALSSAEDETAPVNSSGRTSGAMPSPLVRDLEEGGIALAAEMQLDTGRGAAVQRSVFHQVDEHLLN